jgi:hypothetical protein
MHKLKQIYRETYAGENVVTSLTLSDNNWDPVTEHVPNRVFNTHTTSQAVCIGNGESRLGFDLNLIARHRGGILGADKLQSYGCNALYREFPPDFLVATSSMVQELAESGYCVSHIVYTNGQHIIDYPDKFYLIPQNPSYNAGAIAAYLACFDGHTKVYLLGYDFNHGVEPTNNIYKDTRGYASSAEMQDNTKFWAMTLIEVIKTYPAVDFVRVMPTKEYWLPTELQALPNFRQIDTREFVVEADIG